MQEHAGESAVPAQGEYRRETQGEYRREAWRGCMNKEALQGLGELWRPGSIATRNSNRIERGNISITASGKDNQVEVVVVQ